jgi:hypothetical protein
MVKVQDFVAGLNRRGKSTAEIKRPSMLLIGKGIEDDLNLLCHHEGES